MPPKSIFRQPGAKNFQLVHRSQRDPLIYDPDAGEHVLKEFERKNAKGKIFSVDDESTTDDGGRAPGEAALYGVYFDDRDYDYTQHLRKVGVEESGVDSILIEAPSRQTHKSSKKDAFNLIPKEALPSQHEIPRTYDSGQAIESSIAGFQPDMDPHLRQALEALDDEAFVDPTVEDDFFGGLLADGELEEGEVLPFEFHEDGQQGSQVEEDDWQRRFAKFKLEHRGRVNAASEQDGQSGDGDTLGQLPSLSVAGAKKRRRKGASDASGYSMSSSSMFRNEGLTRLDEQFERFEEEYASDSEKNQDSGEDLGSHSDTSAPDPVTAREDFEAVLEDFLAQEQVGKRLQQTIGGTPLEKLGALRRALVDDEDDKQARARREALLNREDKDDAPMQMQFDIDQRKERWDCETILTTYSNLENHPRLIRLTQPRGDKKIHLDPKTGLPSVTETMFVGMPELPESEDPKVMEPANVTTTRPKDETTEEKKARKQGVKKERQERRKEKKDTKNMFTAERRQQSKVLSIREKAGVRKL